MLTVFGDLNINLNADFLTSQEKTWHILVLQQRPFMTPHPDPLPRGERAPIPSPLGGEGQGEGAMGHGVFRKIRGKE